MSLVNAFSALQTYTANRRYTLYVWISLLSEFYTLRVYLIPAPRLQYGPELLRDARKGGEDVFWRVISVIEASYPIYVRQAVTSFQLLDD